MRRMLRWLTGAMVAAAPTVIKAMFHLDWSDPRLWGLFVFFFGFGTCAYAEGLLDGGQHK